GGAPALVVLDRTIAGQWHVSPKEITAWGVSTLDAVVPTYGMTGRRDEINGKRMAGAEWRMAGDFFHDALYLYEGADAFDNVLYPSGAIGAGVSPILPLKAELLRYFPPEELARRTTIRRLESGDIEVALSLPLASPGRPAGGRDFVARKTYAKGDVRKLDELPVLEVWPDFSAP